MFFNVFFFPRGFLIFSFFWCFVAFLWGFLLGFLLDFLLRFSLDLLFLFLHGLSGILMILVL